MCRSERIAILAILMFGMSLAMYLNWQGFAIVLLVLVFLVLS